MLATIGLTLYGFPYEHGGSVERAFGAYLAGYARLSGLLLSLVEPNIWVNDAIINGRVSLEIVKNCDAMEVVLLFAAATLALDGRRSDRALAVSLGVCAIVMLNLVRISSLYFVRLDFPKAFDTVHLEVWPPVLVAWTVLLFLGVSKWLEVRAQRADDDVA